MFSSKQDSDGFNILCEKAVFKGLKLRLKYKLLRKRLLRLTFPFKQTRYQNQTQQNLAQVYA